VDQRQKSGLSKLKSRFSFPLSDGRFTAAFTASKNSPASYGSCRKERRGFFSAQNQREAQALGVQKVALPGRGRLSTEPARKQKQRWFRRALRWPAGCEAIIGTLKNPFSMWRATYKGDPGFQRYLGGCVISTNLFSIAPHQARPRSHGQVG
jgi:hypothetical protein